MKLSYYTIDDLRLGYDPQGEKGWRISRFLDLRDALEQYRSLPDDAVKVIGVSNGEQDVELVRRLTVDTGSVVQENVLVLDFLALPLWKKEEGVIVSARELVDVLDIPRRTEAPLPRTGAVLPLSCHHQIPCGRSDGGRNLCSAGGLPLGVPDVGPPHTGAA